MRGLTGPHGVTAGPGVTGGPGMVGAQGDPAPQVGRALAADWQRGAPDQGQAAHGFNPPVGVYPPSPAAAGVPPVPGRRSLGHDAVWAVGAQSVAGVLLGLVWLVACPRPPAEWAGSFWYAESDLGFGAAQDIWFGALTLVPGLVVGALLARWSGRPAPLRRASCWLGGAALGSALCWLTGAGLSGGFGSVELAAEVAAAPATLTSWGLLALWPFAASLVLTLSLVARAAFGRTW